MNIKNEVINISTKLFQEEVNEKTKLGDIEKWDSLGHINLFMALEEHFHLSFNPDEIFQNDSISKIIKLIETKK